MSCPLVSVVIPVYNRRDLVLRAVESVFNQTFSDFELIVVNDGSDDDTAEALEAAFGERARIISQNNQGVSAARNRGTRQARGCFVAFLDSDDVWLPNKLSRQAAFHKSNPDLHISQTEEIWIRRGARVNPGRKHQKPEGDIFEPSLHLCAVSPSSVMIRKSILTNSRGFDENLPACEDYDLWLRLSARYRVGLIREKLLTRYGGHSDQLSAKYPAMDRFRIYSLFKILLSGGLNPDQRKQALSVSRKKLDILLTGLRKRDRDASARQELANKVYSGGISCEKFLSVGKKLFLDNSMFN